MKSTQILSFTDNTPFVTLNVEQFRLVVRQEILSVLNQTGNSSVDNKTNAYENLTDNRPYLTIAEAAKLSTLAPSTIRLYIRKGLLVRQKVGRRVVISKVGLEKLLHA